MRTIDTPPSAADDTATSNQAWGTPGVSVSRRQSLSRSSGSSLSMSAWRNAVPAPRGRSTSLASTSSRTSRLSRS